MTAAVNIKMKVYAFILLVSLAIVLTGLLFTRPVLAEGEKTIQDSSGQTVIIDHPYKRIISLYSAHTENICSLGGEDLLAGISRSDDHPLSVLSKPRFSYREDPEKFIALHPDLVLIRPMIERSYPQFIQKLRQAGISVISLQPNSVDEMFVYWRTLGIIIGKEAEAENMIQTFQNRIAVVQESVKKVPPADRPGVYFQSIHKKMKTFAPDSIGIFVLKQAGGINIASDAVQVRKTNIASYGKERLLSHGAEIDIFLAQHGRMNPIDTDSIINEPGFKAIKAVRENKVYLIEEALVSRPTLRILEGIEKLYAIFYPPQSDIKQGDNE
jgi:iron complex transport system substrate-binding protein